VQLILAKISIKFAIFHSSDGNSMNYFNYTMNKIDILIELNPSIYIYYTMTKIVILMRNWLVHSVRWKPKKKKHRLLWVKI
jgi:hypothetical protein